MSEHIYKHIRLTGSSKKGSDDAVKNAVAKAAETVKKINWFKVLEVRGHVNEDEIQYWQATVEIGFRLKD